jgi:hypothetical protein
LQAYSAGVSHFRKLLLKFEPALLLGDNNKSRYKGKRLWPSATMPRHIGAQNRAKTPAMGVVKIHRELGYLGKMQPFTAGCSKVRCEPL